MVYFIRNFYMNLQTIDSVLSCRDPFIRQKPAVSD